YVLRRGFDEAHPIGCAIRRDLLMHFDATRVEAKAVGPGVLFMRSNSGPDPLEPPELLAGIKEASGHGVDANHAVRALLECSGAHVLLVLRRVARVGHPDDEKALRLPRLHSDPLGWM